MRFGICAPLSRIETVKQMGFDYLEFSASALGEMEESEFLNNVSLVRRLDFYPECCNCLIPGSIPLMGDAYNEELLRDHLHRVFGRMRQIGSSVAVFGSGHSRSCPPGMPLAEGCRQLADVTRVIGEIAALYGVRIAIEPLNRSETNTINTVREGARLAADVHLDNVGVMADTFHVFCEEEPLDNLLRIDELFHTHVALLEGRIYPIRPDEQLSAFFHTLAEIGYDGRMSIEGCTDSFETDAPIALALLRELAAQN